MYATSVHTSLSVSKKLEAFEKVYGSPVDNPNPQAIDVNGKTAKNATIGTYIYQPNPTEVSTPVLSAFVDGNMAEFKNQLEVNTKIKLRYAKFSGNFTPMDPYGNYFQVTDLVIALVFDTTTTDYTPVEINNLALNTPWFSDMWYACNMQNGQLQAWLIASAPPLGDNTWLIVGAAAAVAIIGALLFIKKR